MTMSPLFLHYLAIKPLGYAFFGLGMAIEGDVTLFTASFLTHQGLFDPGDMLVVLAVGALAGDTFFYWLGRYFNGSQSFLARWAHRLAQPFDRHLKKRPLRMILISKFAYGMHHALLFRAGALGINPRNFLSGYLAATLLWFGLLGGLGYLSSTSFLLLKHYLRFAELGLLGGLIVFFAISHFIARYSRERLE